MKNNIVILLAVLSTTSCDKHLDNKTFHNKDIIVNWYRISTITTIHDYVDIQRWGYTKNIMEANTDGLYDIQIKGDTVILQVTPSLTIYDLNAKTLGCQIKLDTSISLYKYLKKYVPESAEAFKNQADSSSSENK